MTTTMREWLADVLLRLALRADQDYVVAAVPRWFDLAAYAAEKEREITRRMAPHGAVIDENGRGWHVDASAGALQQRETAR